MNLRIIKVIVGGMGLGISTWNLVRLISMTNHCLGTLSGPAADWYLARTLQNGDPGGHFRRALAHFPFPESTQRVLNAYFVESGITPGTPYKVMPMLTFKPTPLQIDLLVCANFALVWLAKEGHSNPVSLNYLEKIRLPLAYSFVGAMLAGVDCISIGAGIPLQVPGILDALAQGKPANYRVPVEGSSATHTVSFDPRTHFGQPLPELKRPAFLPIISLHVLASLIKEKVTAAGGIQGFVVELPTAGGHNAPPRGKLIVNETNEPVYGPKDRVNFQAMVELGLPFWVGGSYASPESLQSAQAVGAVGIQVGSIGALSNESGMAQVYKSEIRRLGYLGLLKIKTDLQASPTGFPFKVAQLPGTLSDAEVYTARPRFCDKGLLVVPYQHSSGGIGYRCAAEKVNQYTHKGGKETDTAGVCCLCNGLLATCGYGDPGEPPIITLGDDVSFLNHLMNNENDSYGITQAMGYLLNST